MNWRQLQAILWLRWRLSRNQFAKAGKLSAALSIFILAFLGFGAVSFGIGGLAGGIAAGRLAQAEMLLLICDAGMGFFLFLWLIGVLTELQRTESIDLGKLLHLPVTLKQVFLFNFAASHASPALILFLPLVVGFGFGLTIGAGSRMILMIGASLAVLLMITAWTYCLRGWLSGLMADRRRSRNIAVWISILFIALAQAPQLITHSPLFKRGKHRGTASAKGKEAFPEAFVNAHVLIPPGWVGYSAYGLKRGDYLPVLATTVLASLLAAAGLKRSYTLTLRYYRDAQGRDAKSQPQEKAATRRKRLLVERELPMLRDDTAALALATLRSLLRAPEFKLTMLVPVIVLVVAFGSLLGKLRGPVNPTLVPFAVTAGVLMIPFMLAALMSNIFGLDRGGFRALVLSPMPRHRILMARNAAIFPVALSGAVLILVLAAAFFHATITVLLTGIIQAVAGYVLFALLCNYLAILAPYRYSTNTLQAKKFKPVTLLSALASMMIWPIIVMLVAIPAGLQFVWNYFELPFWIPINVISALGLGALVCWLYSIVLPEQGRLLQRRELKILREVTAESE